MKVILTFFIVTTIIFLSMPSYAFPLKQGDYNSVSCVDRSILTSMGIYKMDNGKYMITADAENLEFCHIKKSNLKNNVFYGVANCVGGNKGIPLGKYSFSYTIINPQMFVSNGKEYKWCAEHR